MVSKYNKLKMSEITGYDLAKLDEVAKDTRRELFDLRMDIFKTTSSTIGKKRALKKNLARILTARSAKLSSVVKG